MFGLEESLHTMGYCLWTLLTVLAFVGIAAVLAVQQVRQSNRRKKFDQEMERKYGVTGEA